MSDVTVNGHFSFPEPWWDLTGDDALVREQRFAIESQIGREIGIGHPLEGRVRSVLASCQACDDVLVDLGDRGYARIHLDWNTEQTPSGPIFDSFEDEGDAAKYVDNHAMEWS